MSKQTIITLTFDGIYQETVKFLLPILDRLQIKATFFVVTGSIGNELDGKKTCSRKQLQQILDAGHEIGSHSVEHGLLKTSLSQELKQRARHTTKTHSLKELCQKLTFKRIKKILQDISHKQSTAISHEAFLADAKQSKKVLENLLEEKIHSFAYPGGKTTKSSGAALQSIGYQSARGTTTDVNNLNNLDPYNLHSFMWNYQTTEDHVQQLIEKTSEANWLIETFHAITKTGGTSQDRYTISQSTFLKHIESLQNNPNIVFKTQSEVIQEMYGT